MNKKPFGVILNDFQSLDITFSQKNLIKTTFKEYENVLIIITSNKTRGVNTKNNPFDFETREQMVLDYLSFFKKRRLIKIVEIIDNRNVNDWCYNLKSIISTHNNTWHTFELVVTEMDYTKKYYEKLLNYNYSYIHIIGRKFNEYLENNLKLDFTVNNQSDFRKGILYKSQNTFVNPFPTVDIAVIKENKYVVLGQKQGETSWRFPGGFVDVTDNSYERAALRELYEECGFIEVGPMKYLISTKVDDWRYKNEENKIFSILFVTEFIYGIPKANDDLVNVSWVLIDDINGDNFKIVPEHEFFFQTLKNYVKSLN